MSKRISDFSLPNRNSASARAPRSYQHRSGQGTGTNQRPLRRLQAGTRPANGSRQSRDSLLLADNPFVKLLFDAKKLVNFFFLDRGHRNAGPARHYVFDVVLRHKTGRSVVEVVLFTELAKVLAFFPLFVGIEARLLKLVVSDRVLHAMNDELDALLNIGHFGRQCGLPKFDPCARFVDQIDRLIRQEAVGNESSRGVNGRLDGFIRVRHGVELLVAFLDAEQNPDGIAFVGRRNLYGLEAALQRAIFLNRFPVFSRGGSPMHWISPRDKAGFRMLAASSDPSADPAPTSVCSSSMKMMAF
jgi:hypothetical protein